MASYHFSVQIISRAKGRSALNVAAYRAGERLRDDRTGKTYDYARRRGVVHIEILLPSGAAAFLSDRQQLWAYVERSETRKDAQLAREINVALPHELTPDQRRETLLKFVREAFVSRGMVADVAIHTPVPGQNDQRNEHAHIMLPLRQATRQGLRSVKTREWNSKELLLEWRRLWAEHQNRALERAGHRTRVDHRTLLARHLEAKRRGDRAQAIAFDRKPELHVGPKAQKARQYRRTPPSRDREAGPQRRRGIRPERRVVRYTHIDRGSRADVNLQRMTINLARLSFLLRRYQADGGRHRIQTRGPTPPAAVIRRMLMPRAPDLRPTHPALRRASEPPGFQVRSKFEPLDLARTIARLNRAHIAQLRRRQEFMRRVWGRDHDLLRLRGRVRARCPNAWPSGGPGSV